MNNKERRFISPHEAIAKQVVFYLYINEKPAEPTLVTIGKYNKDDTKSEETELLLFRDYSDYSSWKWEMDWDENANAYTIESIIPLRDVVLLKNYNFFFKPGCSDLIEGETE